MTTRGPAVQALPAATVVLVRDGAHGIEVLLMQRNLQSRFVPGNYIFPGGSLDPEDSAPGTFALCAGLTDAQASAALGVAAGGLAYWVASIREAFEEAGLLLAYAAPGRLVELERAADTGQFIALRRALDEGRASFPAMLRERSLSLATDRLIYFSHWITPVGAPRRYDTRFFAAAAPEAQVTLHDNRETISSVWIAPGQALDRHRTGEFKMRFPTVRTLEAFAEFETADSALAAMRVQRAVPALLPRIVQDGKRLLPGEPGYDEAGKAGSAGQWEWQ